ncbi:MAG: hypothetical protein HQM08_19900 [Candidatus Riflebacteria bacterium]|nr:hypothetical protein [Candidatus Riflebacteria bacterium]
MGKTRKQEREAILNRKYPIDTDIFIDFLRGRSEAVDFIKGIFPEVSVSVVTIAELYAGVREGEERDQLENALASCRQ